MDRVSKEVRSRIMSSIPSKDTGPELRLRKALWKAGLKGYRKHYTPNFYFQRAVDIAFTKKKVAVFMDGCFWHLCPEHGSIPKNNEKYWKRKLEDTVARDAMTTNSMELYGWTVIRIWEHEIKSGEGLENAVERVRFALITGRDPLNTSNTILSHESARNV